MRYRADKVPGSLGKTLPLGYCLILSWTGVQVLGPPLVYLWKNTRQGGGVSQAGREEAQGPRTRSWWSLVVLHVAGPRPGGQKFSEDGP